jgi:hypothetical protein
MFKIRFVPLDIRLGQGLRRMNLRIQIWGGKDRGDQAEIRGMGKVNFRGWDFGLSYCLRVVNGLKT